MVGAILTVSFALLGLSLGLFVFSFMDVIHDDEYPEDLDQYRGK